MKKNVYAPAFRSIPLIIVSWFSCWSPFAPVTHIGQDVISGIDSNATDLKKGFKILDSVNLPVRDARNVTSILPDTSTYKFESGVHGFLFTVGSFAGERSIAYMEIKTWYLRNPNVGKYQRLVQTPDTAVNKAYLRISFSPLYTDTNTGPSGLGGHTSTFYVYSCPAKDIAGSLLDTNPSLATVVDSFIINSKGADTAVEIAFDSASRASIDNAIRDTAGDSTKYKSIGFYVKSPDTAGLFRFNQPVFKLHFKTSKTDSTLHDSIMFGATYYDISVFDTRPADTSLVASWEADRFIEIPISLKPLWDSVKIGSNGGSFRIVQAASCSLFTDTSLFEKADISDTIRTLVCGLLDDTITDSKTHSLATRDSIINNLLNTGRMAVDSVHASPTKLTLPMKIFLQSLADKQTRPETAYLYIFVRPVWHFGRVVLKNTPTIKFSALFSNPHQ